ncbi:CDP-alcohol phosphatidyltransferase [Oesophagostomum dentatum]|uniref:diacylglycerol cholinephosphotransferase n=1 Tax=Oesophagostomum dentatum TaxID=61180 RepID=A0A0B1SUG8_OESDE|nr:CDP-alcohol phosphatidyltransferase [Oesophagostomum dentatum]
MVVTRSGASSMIRADRERRERYVYAPRSHPLLTEALGNKYVDSYLEYDCLMTPEELKRLAEHKYSALDTSYLSDFCMKHFWEWVGEFYPLWLAPNLITLIGLIVNLITVLVLSHYCPTAKEVAPSWAYALAALGLFVYQTLDATDGKQARRTGAASPLGELFDHGCDSISQVFVTLNVAYAMRLGDVRCGTFFVIVVAVSLFYCAHWSTYCTGQLRFAQFDVTEAQMTIILILLITSICGPNVWAIGVLGYQLRHVLLLITLILALGQCSSYLDVIFTGGVGRNGSTVAGTSVLFPVCPLLASIVPFAMIYSKSRSAVFDENITMFMLCFGAVVAKVRLCNSCLSSFDCA